MHEVDYLSKCKIVFSRLIEPYFDTPKGTPVSVIEKFEREHNLILPEAYRQFLLWMGNDRLGVFKGSDWYFANLQDNHELLPWLLQENDILFDERREYICFFSHQGYMASWFYADTEQADPECYFFSEACDLSKVSSVGCFSHFLLAELQSVAKMIRIVY